MKRTPSSFHTLHGPLPHCDGDPSTHLAFRQHQVTQVLNQLTIEFGPQSAQLLDGILLPFIRRTYQLTPGAGSTAAAASAATNGGVQPQTLGEGPGPGAPFGGGGWLGGANGTKSPAAEAQQQQQLLAHEVAERSGLQKLYFSVVQHLSSNGLAGVLSSPTNGAHLDGVLRSVLGGLSGAEDPATKKTCLYIFSLLLGGFNRGRSGGVDGGGSGSGGKSSINGGAAAPSAGGPGKGAMDTRAGAGAPQRRALSGKGGGVWTGSGPTVDMEPGVQAAVTAFVREEVVPAVLRCLVDEAPTGLDLRDATAMSAIVHMGALLKEAKEASGGAAGFVGAAALGCSCTPQVWMGQGRVVFLRPYGVCVCVCGGFLCVARWDGGLGFPESLAAGEAFSSGRWSIFIFFFSCYILPRRRDWCMC